MNKLKQFIAEARKNTYAGDGKPIENLLLTGSNQLEHRRGDYFYRDIYFAGKENFIGQEVVYVKNKPIWSMVYVGSAEPPEITDFLKKSLSILAEKCRFNEKCAFEENNFRYRNKGEGRLEQFHGKEAIFMKGEQVYKLIYQGGLISK